MTPCDKTYITYFTPKAGQHLYLGTSISVLVASSNDDAAMSSLVRALYEMNCCAIARYVWRANSTPKIVALKPIIKSNYHVSHFCSASCLESNLCNCHICRV